MPPGWLRRRWWSEYTLTEPFRPDRNDFCWWDSWRVFLPAFRVTGISDDWYRNTMQVIVIGLGPPRSTGENIGCTCVCRRQARVRRGQSLENLGAPTTSLGAPATCLGAPRITVEQSGKNNIFFGNAASAPGNHRYCLLFNNFQNTCIQFVLSYMYLCIYKATHLHTVLDCGFRRCLSAIPGPPQDDDWVNSEMHSEAVIEHIWRYTSRPWSSQFGDSHGRGDQACLEMNLEAVIEWVRGYSCRPWSSEFADPLGGHD